ncbi:MAG: RNA-processing protein [Archaeoglobaceae archaeon]
MRKLQYKLWFGVLEDELRLAENFEDSFVNAINEKPIPFNVAELGTKVLGKEYYRTLRRVAIRVAEKRVREELSSDERYLIALVKALDSVEEIINVLKEKEEDLEANTISEKFFEAIESMKELRDEIEREIDAAMAKIAPNLYEVAGAKLGAKLIEKFGGIKKLAFASSNKIQIIGAEKSLYKAIARMKRGKDAKIPKHGIIFLHGFVRNLPKKKRGKMARFLASKISIAAKIDYFRGELNEGLFESVKRRFEELRREK